MPGPTNVCVWGEEDMEAPLGRYGSPWVATGGAGRGYGVSMGESCKETLLAAAVALRTAFSKMI